MHSIGSIILLYVLMPYSKEKFLRRLCVLLDVEVLVHVCHSGSKFLRRLCSLEA